LRKPRHPTRSKHLRSYLDGECPSPSRERVSLSLKKNDFRACRTDHRRFVLRCSTCSARLFRRRRRHPRKVLTRYRGSSH
jgi:hypothetical protein